MKGWKKKRRTRTEEYWEYQRYATHCNSNCHRWFTFSMMTRQKNEVTVRVEKIFACLHTFVNRYA